MDFPQYATSKTACKVLQVCGQTLRRWDEEGLIETIRSCGGKRRYNLKKFLEDRARNAQQPPASSKHGVVYARVSSHSQKEDLERQVAFLRSKYPTYAVVRDVASGLNFKRRGFYTLVEKVLKGDVREIVVTHKDRLCRFGFDLVEQICSSKGCKIVVLEESKPSPEKEFVQDLLSIVTVFSSRLYGLRSHKIKCQIRKAAENDKGEACPDEGGEGEASEDHE